MEAKNQLQLYGKSRCKEIKALRKQKAIDSWKKFQMQCKNKREFEFQYESESKIESEIKHESKLRRQLYFETSSFVIFWISFAIASAVMNSFLKGIVTSFVILFLWWLIINLISYLNTKSLNKTKNLP